MTRSGFALLALMALTISLGCAGEKKAGESQTAADADKTASTNADEPRVLTEIERRLVGVWLGEAYLDDQLVQTTLDSVTESQQKTAIQNHVTSFRSTIMAIQFNADGTMEQQINITPVGGQTLDGKSVGNWAVIDHEGNQLIVETVELDDQGAEAVAERLFEISEDGMVLATPAPVDPALANCNPMLLFGRQIMEEALEERTANVQTQTNTK